MSDTTDIYDFKAPYSYDQQDLDNSRLIAVAELNNPDHSQGEWVRIDDYRDLERQLAEAREQNKRLERWKKEQLFVEKAWNPQEVGRLLGMPLAADIRANIQPRIERLIEQRDRLAEACKALLESEGVQRAWPLDGTKRAEKPIDAFSSATATVKFRRLLAIHSALATLDRKEDA